MVPPKGMVQKNMAVTRAEEEAINASCRRLNLPTTRFAGLVVAAAAAMADADLEGFLRTFPVFRRTETALTIADGLE